MSERKIGYYICHQGDEVDTTEYGVFGEKVTGYSNISITECFAFQRDAEKSASYKSFTSNSRDLYSLYKFVEHSDGSHNKEFIKHL